MSEYINKEDLENFAMNCIGGEVSLREIHDFPVADVRPVVHGKWVGNKRHQSCSECHMTYCVPDGQDSELDMTAYHFCPNCGADMREEVQQ